MIRHTSGILCQPMTGEQLDRLDLPQMVLNNTETRRTAFTVSVDARAGTTSGVSAGDRARTVTMLADPGAQPTDFLRPGHIFPLRYREGGVLKRAGHTEAAVDLARMAGLRPSGVIGELTNDDGTMMRMPELEAFAREHGIPLITVADLIAHRYTNERIVERVRESAVSAETSCADSACCPLSTSRIIVRLTIARIGTTRIVPSLARIPASRIPGRRRGSPGPRRRSGPSWCWACCSLASLRMLATC